MKSLFLAALWVVFIPEMRGLDFQGFEPIGDVSSVFRDQHSIVITCKDQSQVRIEVMAAELVRVKASFRQALPQSDHSWAVEKTSWAPVSWKLDEQPDALLISTAELLVTVHRSPLLIEFRNAKNGKVINADERPMMLKPQSSAVGVAKKLQMEEHFYGLGEKAAHLDKRRGQFTMWNTDAYGYKEGTDPLYQSIPFYIGLRDGAAYGIFYDNSYRTQFDLGHTTQDYAGFVADGGLLDYYFFAGPSMKDVLAQYTDLTGHMPLPPMWSLGHQQSRYSYYPDKVVEEIVRHYRADDLPLDAIHLDIHYMNGYRDFTWDPQRFPDPKGLTDKLRKQGVKVVTIVDPGIKYQPQVPAALDLADHPELAPQDKSYYVYNQGQAGGYYLKRRDGRTYLGRVWPGEAVFVDYTIDSAARWWGDLFRAYLDNGVAGIWTDMNEPSDFADQRGQSQADVITYDGGANSPYAQNRNQFALHMARATYSGLERLRPQERPFLITRAGYAGIQRYAMAWTGDNTANWESLRLSLPMFMSLGLSGEAFVGADVGGFAGRTDAELLTRWYEVGFLTPFLRNHTELGSYDHEPWQFGKYYEDIIRKYLKLRYRLMPFLYDAFEEAHRTGTPVFRPLVLNYQEDENSWSIDDEFMVGADVLAAPVLSSGSTSRMVYLPPGTWFDFWRGARYMGGQMIHAEAPLDTIPLFVRGGTIMPLGPAMNWVGEKPSSPITFAIHWDERGKASTSFYEDDGTSPAYTQGVYRRTPITASKSNNSYEITVGAGSGTYRSVEQRWVFEISTTVVPKTVTLDGRSLGRGQWSVSDGKLRLNVSADSAAHQVTIR